MKLCSLDTIQLRKKQYCQIAEAIDQIIKTGEFPDNSAGFEIAKKILIEGNGLTAKNLLFLFLKFILDISIDTVLQAVSFLIALITTGVSKSFTKENIKLLIIFFVLFAVIKKAININEEPNNKIEARLLKNLSYEEYLYFKKLNQQ